MDEKDKKTFEDLIAYIIEMEGRLLKLKTLLEDQLVQIRNHIELCHKLVISEPEKYSLADKHILGRATHLWGHCWDNLSEVNPAIRARVRDIQLEITPGKEVKLESCQALVKSPGSKSQKPSKTFDELLGPDDKEFLKSVERGERGQSSDDDDDMV